MFYLRNRTIFSVRNSSYFFFVTVLHVETMALGLTQPLTEMSTRNVSWG